MLRFYQLNTRKNCEMSIQSSVLSDQKKAGLTAEETMATNNANAHKDLNSAIENENGISQHNSIIIEATPAVFVALVEEANVLIKAMVGLGSTEKRTKNRAELEISNTG